MGGKRLKSNSKLFEQWSWLHTSETELGMRHSLKSRWTTASGTGHPDFSYSSRTHYTTTHTLSPLTTQTALPPENAHLTTDKPALKAHKSPAKRGLICSMSNCDPMLPEWTERWCPAPPWRNFTLFKALVSAQNYPANHLCSSAVWTGWNVIVIQVPIIRAAHIERACYTSLSPIGFTQQLARDKCRTPQTPSSFCDDGWISELYFCMKYVFL